MPIDKKMPVNLKEEINNRVNIHEDYLGNTLPTPYVIKDGHLQKEYEDKEGNPYYKFVSNTPPIINKRYEDIETSEVNYNLFFKDGGRHVNRPVTAVEITQKRHLLDLARYALSVNDKNAIDMVDFISLYLSVNKPETQPVATRLGNINGHLVHPLRQNDVKLFVHDQGYKQIANAFATRGTLEGYQKQVFDLIKNRPMVMMMFYSALGSVLLHDMSVEPFITDLSGKTSAGKSTAQKVAASVWGNDYLVSEWNATKVSIERKASFLNSFPLFLDDTRKADKYVLQQIIYNHSGGRDKGRGNITSINIEKTWENILISTGETSIVDFGKSKAGVAARVITLQEKPFEDMDMPTLYEGIENNYGVLGLAFLDQYQSKRDDYITKFKEVEHHFRKEAKDNEVMQRLGRPFALLQTVGQILNDIAGFQHDYKSIVKTAYQSMLRHNQSIDKPKQLLIELLDMLDANRLNIVGTEYGHMVSKEAWAVYKSDYLIIMPHTLRKELKEEFNSIINQWVERRYIDVANLENNRYQKQVKINGTRYRGYAIPMKLINELGYDFSVDNHIH
ncbi:DUF927 domain-containing protein [Staphylococcus massiliensis]|uniref:DUF927 domain-containing protein n=1 Tax=Staphylococcus massiliensis TaxID=555791 RepID=UPI001EDE0461|nr:DUF927 domain-containing protein [Staphylococcus massiliensis]MCG3401713.1 DUF927 domain-containing protein [Staphylococcus massiliensis]